MRNSGIFNTLFWLAIAFVGAGAVGGIALNRGESINSVWIIVAAICVYAIGYRFYSAFVATKVLVLDATRATPAERLNNGRDFMPTNKWIVFGHHFAAIAGPGPLIGPTLAAQFGYLPGTLWILIGAVLGGCVQDFIILLFSIRRDGRSLGQMARDELGAIGGADDHSDRGIGPGCCECNETQPVGHLDCRRDYPYRDPGWIIFA
ncbi:MAG: carbon starvation protein [Gammaproteobacteria bacterium]|nr:carbon starvation protein [Gammaproteobacteria bacterium]